MISRRKTDTSASFAHAQRAEGPTGFDSRRSAPLVVLSSTSSGPVNMASRISRECSLWARPRQMIQTQSQHPERQSREPQGWPGRTPISCQAILTHCSSDSVRRIWMLVLLTRTGPSPGARLTETCDASEWRGASRPRHRVSEAHPQIAGRPTAVGFRRGSKGPLVRDLPG